MDEKISGMSIAHIGLMIQRYEDLRAQAETLKDTLDALNKQKDAAEAEVISAILDAQEKNGVDTLHVTCEGRTYSVTVKNYYTIPKAKRDAAFAAMRDLGMGDLIQERVDDRTLSKELSGVFEENGGMYPDEYAPLFAQLSNYGKSTLHRVKS